MTRKSSSAMSSLAARVLKMRLKGEPAYDSLLADAKALAGSVLSQDEQKGQAQ